MKVELIDLRDCQPANLVWVAGWYGSGRNKPTGWHLYQFGLSPAIWDNSLPVVMPVCRAPSFERAAHNVWISTEFENYVPGDWAGSWCHKCIVEIVLKFPHIFKENP